MHHASQGMHYVSLVPSIKFLVFVVSQLRNDEIVQNPKWKGRGFKGTRLCLKVLYNFNSVSLFIFCWHARWLFRYLNECSIFSWLDCITILFLFLVPWVWRCHVSSSRGSWRQSNISLCSRGRAPYPKAAEKRKPIAVIIIIIVWQRSTIISTLTLLSTFPTHSTGSVGGSTLALLACLLGKTHISLF